MVADNFRLGQNVSFLEFLLQVVHHGECVIGVIIAVSHEPQAATERAYHLGICGVLHLPCVVAGPQLETPNLVALNDCVRDIPQELVHVLETLCRAVKADVIVPAAQQRIEEVGIEVILKAARVHLNGKFIHGHNGYCKRFFLVVYGLRGFACLDDLRKTF